MALKGTDIHDVTLDRVENQLAEWKDEREWSPATYNNALSQLSGVMSYAYRKGWIQRHPLRGRAERMHVNNERTRYLRTHEVAALKNEALKVVAQEKEGQPESVLHERWLYDIIVAAVSTGLRRGKLCAVRCRDVERDDKGNLWLFIGEDKNGQPLNKPVAGELKGIVEHRLACAIGDAFLLPGPRNGNAYSSIARYLPVVVERVAEAHPDWGLRWGISRDGITFHTLRHSMASLAANNGVPLDVVQRMGNWRTASMMRRYAHLADERLQDGEARLAAVLHISSQSAKDEDSDEVLSR